ncbi:piercer of microtubule wall 2 protein isoform X2 [Hemibagrus wyckioides]|uniref:piercer of microtubule wall 2 protein isoform X2 n=2 Tax=Hemibagrus wyckioides TaxID=337641 RepID=UPI00266B86D5|nr:piercer of microtubule wall 2 protein isoform X2 [Hemibagrus wyckioides]
MSIIIIIIIICMCHIYVTLSQPIINGLPQNVTVTIVTSLSPRPKPMNPALSKTEKQLPLPGQRTFNKCPRVTSVIVSLQSPSMKDKMSQTEEHQQNQNQNQNLGPPCLNPGNPVFSCTLNPSSSSGQSLLYRTTSCEYGSRSPTFESSPCVYHPMSQAFSKHLGTCGMSRDTSFNTSLDRSKVCDRINLHNTI